MTKLETNPVRSFDEWWSGLNANFEKNSRKDNRKNKTPLNQITYVIVHNNLKGNGHLNPTLDELRHWIRSDQIGVTRRSV